MNDVGKEYGAALFMVACEADKKKDYFEALRTVKAKFEEYPEYPVFLASPSIPLSERLGAVESAFAAILPEHVVSFLMLLCEKGRMDCFDTCVQEYDSLLAASEHISNARVTSATELTNEEKEKLKAKLESFYKGKVHIEYCVDKALLGGLVVKVDGKIMDGSLRHRLHDVKEVISQ